MIKVRLLSLFAIGGLAVTLIFMIGALGGQADGQMDGPVSAALPPFAVLHSFNPNSGDGSAINWSSLTLSGTTLYGTTADGGANGKGIIFKFDTKKNIETVLHSFGGTSDGADPTWSLTLSGTTLYGMTWQGGTSGWGTIFKFDTKKNVETVLYNFGGTSDGANPSTSLILSETTLYGMTCWGGAGATYHGNGTVFAFDTKKNVQTVLYNFRGTSDGTNPFSTSLALLGTTLYGTTSIGGASGAGTIFSIPDLPLSTISGTVESSGLNPEVMDGVTVTLSQSNQTSQTLSDSSGAYSFNDLGPSRYTVTPSLTGYTFTPKSASVSVSGTNLTENFTGAPITISGMVTFNDGPVTTDLTMILSGKATETNPAPSGAYAFGPMMNGSYKVRPALTAHPNPVPQTTPSSATVVINGKSVTQNFTYTTNATCFTAGCHVK